MTTDDTTFRNEELKVGGSLNQAAGDIGGSATSDTDPSSLRKPRTTMFENKGVEVKGDVNQAAGNIYQHSVHVQGGTAVVTTNPQQRYGSSTGIGGQDTHQPQQVLAIFAEPRGLRPTDWQSEARVLRDVLLPFEQQYALREYSNSTPDYLYQVLLSIQPSILHFQGHGTREGLAFEDMLHDVHIVGWQELMNTLTACETLTCVVLNACDSHVHAQVGPQRFHLITTPGAVSIETTHAFTQGFYAALRAGRSIPLAYRDGCNLLGMKGIARDEWPVLTEGRTS
jgi:hypothetical protein